MFFQNFGIWQILILLLVILILFGVGKLPEVGRGLGKAISEFRSNVKDKDATEAKGKTEAKSSVEPESKAEATTSASKAEATTTTKDTDK